MKTFRFIILAIVAFGFTVAPAGLKIEYTFKVGDQYTWEQSTKQTIKQSVMGMEQVVDNQYVGAFQLRVTELTKTGAKIEASYTKLKNATKSPMGETVMDSDGSQETTENKVFKALTNKPFFIFMDKRGQIEKLEGVDNLWSGLGELGLDDATQNAMKQSLQQFMSESSLKSTFEQVLITYPEKSVAKGDAWSHTTEMPMNMSVKNTWSVAEVSASTADLTGDGVYTTSDSDKTMDLPGGLKAKTALSGKQAMKSKIDVKSGWPTKMDILSELKGTMTLLAGGMIPEDMEVPMEIVSETTYTITKK